MHFRLLIEEHYEEFSLENPASEENISNLESIIGREVPPELREFLLQTNGARIGELVEIFGIENELDQFESIMNEFKDVEYEKMYPNAQGLFFFAADGMGGFYGYTPNNEIVHWDHEEDKVFSFEPSGFNTFLLQCYTPLE